MTRTIQPRSWALFYNAEKSMKINTPQSSIENNMNLLLQVLDSLNNLSEKLNRLSNLIERKNKEQIL